MTIHGGRSHSFALADKLTRRTKGWNTLHEFCTDFRPDSQSGRVSESQKQFAYFGQTDFTENLELCYFLAAVFDSIQSEVDARLIF